MRPRPLLALVILLGAATLAGCASNPPAATDSPAPLTGEATPSALLPTTYAGLGFDGTTWPRLNGHKVVILDHGAFDYAFGPAKKAFENLTGATVEHIAANDAGSALERAIREKGNPSFDVLYGVDNVLLSKAIQAGVFEPYKPALASRINASHVFFDPNGSWYATPVDHGYIAVNVDPRANLTVETLHDLKANAGVFVTQDPRTSTPGLGFLLATVATYGDGNTIEGTDGDGEYDYLDYWNDLFAGGVLVTSGWTEAYVQHFTGGYGRFEDGFSGQRAIVTSYSTSPAYEIFYGSDIENRNVLAPRATFHQIQTMGIVAGTKNGIAAQAWIEFTLTDAFQNLAAEYNAIYPVVDSVDVSGVYDGKDPAPGTFHDTGLAYDTIGANVERWIRAWVDTYERHRA